MKIEIKHLAAYVQYGLKILVWHKSIATMTDIAKNASEVPMHRVIENSAYKPLLRPLSEDFIQELATVISIKFAEIYPNINENIEMIKAEVPKYLTDIPYWLADEIFQLHGDYFNLIPNGLAIDINTLEALTTHSTLPDQSLQEAAKQWYSSLKQSPGAEKAYLQGRIDQKSIDMSEVERVVREYWNRLHSWEDSNPVTLINKLKEL